MFRRLACLCLLSAATLSASNMWIPYAEVRGRGGDYRSGAMLYGFAPLVQNDCSLLFAQGNIGQMRHQTTGSLGFGYRRKIECDSFFGVAAFADWARTGQHNNYLQGVVSGELIVRWAELRANGYFPYTKSHVLDTAVEFEAFVEELNIKQITRSFQTAEQAYPGFDVEGGFNQELGCNSRIRGYAAYFHYARQGVSDIYGPRVRVRYELDNMGCCGARLIAEGLWQHDSVRGHKGEAMIGFRVPLCRPKCCNLCPAERRMNDLVERDIGLITRKNTRQTSESEEVLARLFFFERDAMGSGTQDDPASLDYVLMEAQRCDILFGLNNDSNLPIDLTASLQLKKGQRLYGFDNQSSVAINVKGAVVPITINDTTGNGRAELRQAAMAPVVEASDNTIIFGLKLTDGTTGINIDEAQNVVVQKMNVENPIDTGIFIQTSSDIVIDQSTLAMSSGLVGFSAVNSSNIAACFDSFDVTVENNGILWDGSSGSFEVTGATSIDGLLANSSGISAINNSAVDFMFDTIMIEGTAANKSDGLLMADTSSTLTATDVTILDTQFGIHTDGTGITDWTFDSLNLGTDPQRLETSIFVEADTNITVFGNTDIWVERRFVAWPVGIHSFAGGDLNGTFGDITITLDDNPNATGIELEGPTNTIIAGDVEINNTAWGLYTFADTVILTTENFTVTPSQFGIDWDEATAGSFTAADITITEPGDAGVHYHSQGPSDFFCFDNLTITDATQLGIDLENSQGTFTVNELTKLDNPGNYGIYAHGSPNSVDIDLNRLEIAYDNVGSDGVRLADYTGDFTVTNGGKIIHNVAGDQSGLFGTDCTGTISISGSPGDLFEIAGAGQGIGAGLLCGIGVTDTTGGNLATLALDYMNIHNIGSGMGLRHGVIAFNVVDEVSVTNSMISDINGSPVAFNSPAIEVNNVTAPNPPSGTLTVTVQNNEIFGAADFSTTQTGLAIFYGDTDPTNQLVAHVSENTLYQLERGVYVSLTENAGTNSPNTVEIHDNTIRDLGGTLTPGDNTAIWLQPTDSTRSIFCITENTINAETNAPASQADYAIHLDPVAGTTAAYDVQLTIKANMINPASTSDFQQNGIDISAVADANTRSTTALIDNNTINDVMFHGVLVESGGNETTTVTLTNNISNGDALAASEDSSTLNVLFGDPNNPGSNGNNFATQYGLSQIGGTFNLGSTGVAANATQALTNLGNTTGGISPPTVVEGGTILLLDANTTNFPQPMPCP